MLKSCTVKTRRRQRKIITLIAIITNKTTIERKKKPIERKKER